MGIDPSRAIDRARSQSRGRSTIRKAEESTTVGKKRARQDAFSPGQGLKDEKVRKTISYYYIFSIVVLSLFLTFTF